jgi:FixJ family two-component response regulator
MTTSPTIFVLDDDEVVRDSLKVLLESRRYAVNDFESGSQLLSGWNGAKPACLILDIHMPGMTGLDVLRELRGRGDPIPVILITGRRDTIAQTQAHALGAVALLDKPVPHSALFAAIDQALGTQPA